MLVAVLAYGVVQLLASTQLYATALIAAGVAACVIFDIARLAGRAERWAQHDFERLAVVGSDLPLARLGELPAASEPFERAASLLNAARAERQQQLEYLQTLLDTVAAALIVVDADGRVTLANRAARALASGSVDRLDKIDALGASGARHLLALAPGAREIVSLAEGRRVFVSVSQFTVPGQPPRRLLSLQRIAGELDAVEVKAWQDMADVLAHEMMNSLTPIASLSESLETLLREREQARDPEEVAGALEAIKRRSRGLMDFVARYRAVAELPAPQTQRVRMDEFFRGIDRLLAPTFRDRCVAYRSSVSPADLACVADPQLLEQAVINLLRNAADAVAGAREPRIEVTCELSDGRMVMAIADNGAGVPEARREQIFVPFFTTKAGGSGIGLNLARHVVLGHGGQLDVRANAPRGAVFTVTLPAAA
jgi:nitrogen fixation/metabolism regulation signal transduction histidine kinase